MMTTRAWITMELWLAIAIGVWLHVVRDYHTAYVDPYDVAVVASQIDDAEAEIEELRDKVRELDVN